MARRRLSCSIDILLSLAFWVDLLHRANQSPTLEHLTLMAGAFLGPALFGLIAHHFRVSAELRKLAKLSFARLEVEGRPTGIVMQLSCSGCGGTVDASAVKGLTIRCKHCKNAMLAPARLVEAGQQHFMRQVLALRRRLTRNVFAREVALVVVGLAYFAIIVGVALALRGVEVDDLTGWLLVTFFYPFTLVMFWVFTHQYDGWELVGIGFAVAGFPLGPVVGLIFWYLDLHGVTPPPPGIPR